MTKDDFWIVCFWTVLYFLFIIIFMFQTPPGLYCPDRISTKPFPNIGNKFTFRGQIVIPAPGLDELIGSVKYVKVWILFEYLR